MVKTAVTANGRWRLIAVNIKGRILAVAAATALIAVAAATASAQNLDDGFKAWEAGRHEEAVRQWRALADAGNADAQFALGHAYRLGRGVPQNLNLAEQWYERAARGGHEEAQAMYGVILFQNGRRQEALPYIERGAASGDPRAQYVLGTVLFNGDYLPQDYPRAYALMTRSAAQGLPQAESHLREMDQILSDQDKARGTELARSLESQAPPRLAETAPPAPVLTAPPRVATVDVPASRPAQSAQAQQPPQPRVRPDHPAPAQQTPVAAGRWRVQLGAFSSEANARRAWETVRGRVPGLQPFYVRAGALIRLQAGPLPDRATADRNCGVVRGAGGACLVVAP
jgi:uncharacterized protein